VRVTLGEFEGVSAALPTLSEHGWSAEDSYSVRFRLRSGVNGVLQASAGDWGPPLMIARIAGTRGTVWSEGDAVYIADQSGTRPVAVPDDLVAAVPNPPDPALLVTAYDLMHSTGIDLGPYTRLSETFRDLIRGVPVPADPAPATFADGVANQMVLDAIRASAAEGTWVPVPTT
jgi:predicted dehydrogenase